MNSRLPVNLEDLLRQRSVEGELNAMKENGSPAPEFETNDDRSYFLIRLPVHPETASAESSEKGSEKGSEKTSDKILSLMRRNSQVTIHKIAIS